MQRAADLTRASTIDEDTLQVLDEGSAAKALFPDEQRLRKKLWNLLEWPKLPAPKPPRTIEPLRATDITKIPKAPPVTLETPIKDLPEQYQQLAGRVLLLAGRGKDTSIRVADVQAANEHKSGLTIDEGHQLRDLGGYLERIRLPKSTMRAVLDVPSPGTQRMKVEHRGTTPITLVAHTKLEERRDRIGATGASSVDVNISLSRKLTLEVEVSPREQVILLAHNRNGADQDIVLGPGVHSLESLSGTHRVERWCGRERTEVSDIEIPSLAAEELDLTRYDGYQFRANGDPLPAVLREYIEQPGLHNSRTARHSRVEYDFGIKPIEATPEHLESARVFLETGRYQAPSGAIVEVFEEGAVRFMVDGEIETARRDSRGAFSATLSCELYNNGTLYHGGGSFNLGASDRIA